MPPVEFLLPCTTVVPDNITTSQSDALELAKDDRNALLYIVVTLLFYSMGIIVGIITYIKRERQEMLEEKTFDVYFQMKSDPYTTFKSERVQMIAARLAALEQARLEKVVLGPEAGCSGITPLNNDKSEPSDYDSSPPTSSKSSTSLTSSSGNSRPTSIQITFEKSPDISGEDANKALPTQCNDDVTLKQSYAIKPKFVEDNIDNISKPDSNQAQRKHVFQVSPSGEPMASAVAKIFESERRGGLLMSPKALHLFDRGKRRLKNRQLSMDVPDREMCPILKERHLSMDLPHRELIPNLDSDIEHGQLLVNEKEKNSDVTEDTKDRHCVSEV